MRIRIMWTMLMLLSVLIACRDAAAEPSQLGYERWTATGNRSGVIFSQSPEYYYGTFADRLKLINDGKASPPPAPNRLVDIEMEYHPSTGDYSMDVVWIRNEGNFQTRSWMLYNLTKEDVLLVAQLPKTVILDIESYGNYYSYDADDARFAVILRENPQDFESVVFAEATWSEIAPFFYNQQSWRAIDFDVLQESGEYLQLPSQYDDSMNRYNAVFVDNTPEDNFKETMLFYGDIPDMALLDNMGFQLIDVEDTGDYYAHYFPNDPYSMIFVQGGQPFTFAIGMSESELVANWNGLEYFYDVLDRFVRCVDLEGYWFHERFNPEGRKAVFISD